MLMEFSVKSNGHQIEIKKISTINTEHLFLFISSFSEYEAESIDLRGS